MIDNTKNVSFSGYSPVFSFHHKDKIYILGSSSNSKFLWEFKIEDKEFVKTKKKTEISDYFDNYSLLVETDETKFIVGRRHIHCLKKVTDKFEIV